ncbi:uncharacterized protein LOC111346949 [Stylophora pistillata]|uniref:uncharacterized protein LOC111346949 n=1 Tax=Stylophora pistillata TaxID=50429 RepID=UPI000C0397DF|nr:uncharacterized protein LOC111346949 [Stylophora pistillata]
MDDCDTKARLPVHVIISVNDFAKIRTSDPLRVGRRGDPVAERTRFGWTIMSSGTDLGNVHLAVNSTVDHNRLCTLDVLGLEDKLSNHQSDVQEEFKEQLVRSPDGRYETGLPWKGNCPELPNNCAGSVCRVNTLLWKLKRTDMLDQCDDIIREQLEEGVVEKAPAKVTGKEFYMPHQAVIRENAKSTKLRVVYDASARAYDGAPSLNECLHTGPPLQNELWNLIVRNRFHPIAVGGDMRKAFLQIQLESDCTDDEPPFAKQQLGASSARGECNLLGLNWDKGDDTLHVSLPSQPATLTKRGILANLAKIYDPLGLVSPAILVQYQEPIDNIKLHAFGDASIHSVCAAVYAVVTQASGVTQGLIVAKSHLPKKSLTIPRLELVSGHMAVNLSTNVRVALEGFSMTEDIQCWLDSTVALHWLNDDGEYRQFVANRVKKTQSHPNTQWRNVPTPENPADLGSRGGSENEAQLWWKSPPRLSD